MSALTVRPATDADRNAWERHVEASDASEAAHAWGFHDLLEKRFGVSVHRLASFRDGKLTGVLPLVYQKSLVGRFLTSVPYLNHAGVLSSDGPSREALALEAAALGERLGARRLELRGRDGSDLPLPSWEGKSGYLLDLQAGRDALWKALGSKVRAQVKRPLKQGYVARTAAAGEIATFYRVLARRWHQLGSPVLPRTFFEDLDELFGERLSLVFVESEGETVAAGALLEWNGRVEIPWAASALEHNRFGVNMLLYWSALEHAIDRGASWFDFGRSTPGTGTARFKLQWGAEEAPLSWNVQVSGRSGAAAERESGGRQLVARTWKLLPEFIAGRLGPCLAARIPY